MASAESPPYRIDRLEIENFKSYKGIQVIGPFRNFTAIIGPNGAGKSNLMDAISFVLGVRSAHLRGTQLKDLIYALEDSEKEKPGRKSSVSLVFSRGATESLYLSRSINSSGHSEYHINGTSVTWEEYNARLRKLGILVKARNFLVFQGDVESVASKTPKELTTLLEQVSGSEELKKEYDRLDEVKSQMEEKVAFNFQKRRGITAERKQKKEQKEEAERHLELLEKQKTLKLEYALWQLFKMENDKESAENELQNVRNSLEEVEAQIREIEIGIKERKKEQSRVVKELSSLEKQIIKKTTEIEKKKPDLLRYKEELNRVNGQAEKANAELASKKSMQERQKEDMASLRKKLKDVDNELAAMEEVGLDKDKINLAESQAQEYRKIKAEAGKKTARLFQERESLGRQQQAEGEALAAMDGDAQEMEKRKVILSEQKAQVSLRLEEAKRAMEEGRAELVKGRVDATSAREQARRDRACSEGIEARLGRIEGQLRELRAERRENEREAKAREVVGNLKRLFPGVLGRLSELCRPREKKYSLAVSIVMGRMIDAVVVDSESTGKDCIEYLRGQREAPLTFIPLQTARVKPLQESLRNLRGSAKLVIDVIQYDPSHEVALLYAVGNTLVCESVDEAKSLAWGAQRHKALKEEREKLLEDLSQTPTSRDLQAQENSWAARLASLERSLNYSETEVKMLEQKSSELGTELAALEAQRSQLGPQLESLRKSMASRAQKMEILEKRAQEVEDLLFREFSASVGVTSIRQYEESRLKVQEERASQKLALSVKKSRILSQLEFEKSRGLEEASESLREKVTLLNSEISKLEEKLASVKKKQEISQKELKELQKAYSEVKSESETIESSLQEEKQKASKLLGQAGKHKRDLGALEGQLEQIQGKKAQVFEQCQLEGLKLGSTEGDTLPMEVDSGGAMEVTGGGEIDFSGLRPRLRRAVNGPERDSLESELKATLEELASEIERTAPNLKALEQYEVLRQRERGTVEEFEAVRREAKEISEEFARVKQERYSRFMSSFEHISGKINSIYGQLTRSVTHPLGGTAYLALENEDEPFQGGIRYTAMPPTKRFRDMEQLSGGERTVAALALLFAVHSYRPSPFFVLDEVDAALDNLNVAKVAAFIGAKAKAQAEDVEGKMGEEDAGFQSVVISLKDQFYDKADALVGVYRDVEQGCSKTLTFDLENYPVE